MQQPVYLLVFFCVAVHHYLVVLDLLELLLRLEDDLQVLVDLLSVAVVLGVLGEVLVAGGILDELVDEVDYLGLLHLDVSLKLVLLLSALFLLDWKVLGDNNGLFVNVPGVDDEHVVDLEVAAEVEEEVVEVDRVFLPEADDLVVYLVHVLVHGNSFFDGMSLLSNEEGDFRVL